MVQNYTVWVEKKAYPVVVSDERKALLAAKAAGRAFVGLIHLEEYGGGNQKEERTEKARHQSYCEQKTSRSKRQQRERRRMTSGMQSIWQRRTPSARSI